MILGFQVSQAIHVAATLGLADHLACGPRGNAELAAATKAHPLSLYRLMRVLASVGVFHQDEEGRFVLTAVGEFLRNDVAGTHAPMAEMIGRPNFWQAWGDLLYAVRTGATAFDHVHGRNVWAYRAERPDEARVFDRAMASATARFAEAVLDVCDFSGCDTVVDIGGGDGTFLAKILAEHPHIGGTVFDQPRSVARAAASIDAAGLAGRCRAVGGDFFVGVPAGGDAYLLKWILHDWDDTASIDILRSCRRAMSPGGRLIVVEHVIGPLDTFAHGALMDVNMMVMTGGRVRSRDEFAALFAEAGFRLVSVTPTATPLSVIEGAPDQA
jgi:SAM-dependent methyltransferase